ncbi:YdcF family protein [Phormidium tenue FACHB-886]|nr:YdcF family protein [Phormidium tenue FACHB-886]
MFDSPLCKRPFTPFPLFLNNWGALEGIRHLVLAGLVLLGSLMLYWVVRRMRRKRFSARQQLIVAIMLLGLLGLNVAERGLTLFLPADSGEPMEAIVLLGRGPDFGVPRIELATELWRASRAPIVFVSGTWDAPKMLTELQVKGIPPQALDGENCSQTTPENAIFSAAILQTQGIHRILLITDPLHLWRSLLDFEDEGFSVVPHASPLPMGLSFWDKSFLVFREYLFMFTASLDRLVHGRHSYQLDEPKLTELVAAAREYGRSNPR